MKFKALAAAVICATSSLCAPAVVVTPSAESVSGVTVFNMITSVVAGSMRKARPASSAVQPGMVVGYTEQLLAFKNSLSDYSESLAPSGSFNSYRKPAHAMSAMTGNFNKLGDAASQINFNAVAALSEKQEQSTENGYSLMLLTGLAVMGAIALRRGSGQGV